MSLQAERWLAAAPITLTAGTAAAVTLKASSDMFVDLRRLCIQVGGYDSHSSDAQWSPTFGDQTAMSWVTSILIKDAFQSIRGTSSPSCPASYWSPLRAYNSVPLAAAGDGNFLSLAAGETIVITINSKTAVNAIAFAAVPCVLVTDKGRNFLPAGYSPDQAQSVLGSAPSTATASSNTATISDHSITYSEAGVAYIHDLALVAHATEQAESKNQNEPMNLAAMSAVTKIQGVQQDQYIVGTASTGSVVGVPLLCYAPGGIGYRPNAWARLPAQPGSSSNTVVTSAVLYGGDNLGAVALQASVGFQSAGAGGTIPVCL